MTILSYPQNLLDDSKNKQYPHFVTFAALIKGKPSETRVVLYLPVDALKSSYTQAYGDTDVGATAVLLAGEGGDKAAQAMAGAMQGADGSGPIGVITSLLTGVVKGAAASNLEAALLSWTAGAVDKAAQQRGGGAIAALKKKAGMIMNPHKAILYSGPGGFRTFSFNYVMTPENIAEATSIAEIVHFFKLHMHPGTPGEQVTGGVDEMNGNAFVPNDINTSMTLSYPEEFQIKMHVNRKHEVKSRNPLFNIKNCFLESLNVDYATSGGPAFITTGGTSVPATTTMALQFKETELMTKTSIREGF